MDSDANVQEGERTSHHVAVIFRSRNGIFKEEEEGDGE